MVTEQALTAANLAGNIVATGVSYDEYMAQYAEDFCEWAEGVVIKMSPVHERHDKIFRYLLRLMEAYLILRPIGQLRVAPFVMKLDHAREPDLQIILDTNPGDLTPTAMRGPADLCIEIVSPGSIEIDYGEKFQEYQAGGVREYWIIDPLRRDAVFHRLDQAGEYATYHATDDGHYTTPLLPGLSLHAPTLWLAELPDQFVVGQAVRAMLGED